MGEWHQPGKCPQNAEKKQVPFSGPALIQYRIFSSIRQLETAGRRSAVFTGKNHVVFQRDKAASSIHGFGLVSGFKVDFGDLAFSAKLCHLPDHPCCHMLAAKPGVDKDVHEIGALAGRIVGRWHFLPQADPAAPFDLLIVLIHQEKAKMGMVSQMLFIILAVGLFQGGKAAFPDRGKDFPDHPHPPGHDFIQSVGVGLDKL